MSAVDEEKLARTLNVIAAYLKRRHELDVSENLGQFRAKVIAGLRGRLALGRGRKRDDKLNTLERLVARHVEFDTACREIYPEYCTLHRALEPSRDRAGTGTKARADLIARG